MPLLSEQTSLVERQRPVRLRWGKRFGWEGLKTTGGHRLGVGAEKKQTVRTPLFPLVILFLEGRFRKAPDFGARGICKVLGRFGSGFHRRRHYGLVPPFPE